jgi:ATP-binding cassette subfamily G (WHITE) protein 2 (SNQ2)
VRELQRQISRRTTSIPSAHVNADRKASDVELGSIDPDNFDMKAFLSGMLDRSRESGNTPWTLPLCFQGLTVQGRGSGVEEGADVGSLLNPFGALKRSKKDRSMVKSVVTDITGFVRPGEMLIVAGVPGSGCTTLLKTLVGHRQGYQAVVGDVSYGGWSIKEVETFLRGDVVYCGEEDV